MADAQRACRVYTPPSVEYCRRRGPSRRTGLGSDTSTHEGGSLSMKALAIDDDRAWTATRLAPVIWLAVTTAAVWASEAALVPSLVMAGARIATGVPWPGGP